MPKRQRKEWLSLTKLLNLPVPFASNPPTLKPRQSKQVKGGSGCFVSD
nr:MAG TPA: hypothetical protein [Caudoviricetes sp.]